MEIIIGKQGNQPIPLTESSISRRHAILTVDDTSGAIRLRDNNSTNGTWILCPDGKFKRLSSEVPVSPDTTIRLGAATVIKVKDLIKKQETTVDISNLRYVYDTYNDAKLQIEAEASNIMMLRMASMSLAGILSMVANIVIPKDFVGDEITSNLLKVGFTIFSLAFAWIVVDRKNKGIIRRKSNNEAYLKQSYCCPKCGFHFGTKVYSNLLAEGRCPNNNCKCKFTGQ